LSRDFAGGKIRISILNEKEKKRSAIIVNIIRNKIKELSGMK